MADTPTKQFHGKPLVVFIDGDKIPLGTIVNTAVHDKTSSLLLQVHVNHAWKLALTGNEEGGWVS